MDWFKIRSWLGAKLLISFQSCNSFGQIGEINTHMRKRQRPLPGTDSCTQIPAHPTPRTTGTSLTNLPVDDGQNIYCCFPTKPARKLLTCVLGNSTLGINSSQVLCSAGDNTGPFAGAGSGETATNNIHVCISEIAFQAYEHFKVADCFAMDGMFPLTGLGLS